MVYRYILFSFFSLFFLGTSMTSLSMPLTRLTARFLGQVNIAKGAGAEIKSFWLRNTDFSYTYYTEIELLIVLF